jgi:hypothetical protein
MPAMETYFEIYKDPGGAKDIIRLEVFTVSPYNEYDIDIEKSNTW